MLSTFKSAIDTVKRKSRALGLATMIFAAGLAGCADTKSQPGPLCSKPGETTCAGDELDSVWECQPGSDTVEAVYTVIDKCLPKGQECVKTGEGEAECQDKRMVAPEADVGGNDAMGGGEVGIDATDADDTSDNVDGDGMGDPEDTDRPNEDAEDDTVAPEDTPEPQDTDEPTEDAKDDSGMPEDIVEDIPEDEEVEPMLDCDDLEGTHGSCNPLVDTTAQCRGNIRVVCSLIQEDGETLACFTGEACEEGTNCEDSGNGAVCEPIPVPCEGSEPCNPNRDGFTEGTRCSEDAENEIESCERVNGEFCIVTENTICAEGLVCSDDEEEGTICTIPQCDPGCDPEQFEVTCSDDRTIATVCNPENLCVMGSTCNSNEVCLTAEELEQQGRNEEAGCVPRN